MEIYSDEYDEAIEVAVDALNKQIAVEPADADHFTDTILIGRCPMCGEEVHEDMNYCQQCGQRLSWWEEGDEE